MILVVPADPRDEDCAALLAQSHALMQSMFAADECHFLDIEALCADHIRFFAASDGDQMVGTGAVAMLPDYAEIKSMFTAPAARGRGVADAVLQTLLAQAAREGATQVRLETGVGLDAAHRLYERHGFERCAPFGSYVESPASLFYGRALGVSYSVRPLT